MIAEGIQTSKPGVLVTGCGGGLGTALVRKFGGSGWEVGATYRASPFPAEPWAAWQRELDVTRAEQVEGLAGWVKQSMTSLRVVVCNAGVCVDSPIWELELSDWCRTLDVNLAGAFRCARAFGAQLVQAGRGHLLLIGSFAGLRGSRGQAAYSASKAGLIGLGQALALEWGRAGVQVNVVLPGVLMTPMTARLTRERLEELTQANALLRLSNVEEVAGFIEFVSRLENVSGQVFQLDSRISPWAC